MNALILGKNAANAAVEKNLASYGIKTTVVPELAGLLKFQGEPGAYTVTTSAGQYSFASVIITEPPQFEGAAIGGGLTINLMNEDETGKRLDGLKTDKKIVILLDYPDETPEYITARAVCLAIRLAERKKDVVFLSKTVKSGYGDNEIKFAQARDAGVSFVKYESLNLCYDEEADTFKIEAGDGVFDINIDTPYLISLAAKETPQLKNISKKLRLHYKAQGGINDDKFFLYPAFTSRRGIYYLNPALVMPEKDQSIGQAVSSIVEDMASITRDGYQREITRGWQFPEVDADKCAFCYSCVRACPHGALAPNAGASAMKVVESECEACGTCIAICPGEAIRRKDFSPKPAGRGECKIYCCENGAAQAFESILPSLGEYGQIINCEPVACGGSVSTDMLAGDFKNYQTLIVACCIEDSCRHMDGDRRACKQSLRAAELSQAAGLKGRRVEVIKASAASSGVMKDNILSILER
ncbi:MAG: 4Fe-4S binding protein [Spirochaetes bacterium]|nr:4Fe-4S binding protein [Spirochaetota bacterium]